MSVDRGDVITVSLDPTVGHEQRGYRPCIVVSDPSVAAGQRFPLLGVVPLTGTPGVGALYPSIAPEGSGLKKRSWALIDQVRSIDKRRVSRWLGSIDRAEMQAIDEGLRLYLGLEPSPS